MQVNLPLTWFSSPYWQQRVFTLPINVELGLDATALDQFDMTDFRIMSEKLHRRGLSITVHGPFLDLSPGSPDAAVRGVTKKRFGQLVRACEFFRPRTVVCHTGYDEDRYSFCRDAWLEESIKTWQWLAERLLACGSRLMLENVYEREPEDLLAVLEPLASGRIGCCLDVGHKAVFSKQPLAVWIRRLAPFIGQFHLHDNLGDRDAHLPLGEGMIELHPVFDFIAACSQTPIITLEPHQEEDLGKSLSFLAQHWAAEKT